MRSSVVIVIGLAAIGAFVLYSLRREPMLPADRGDLPQAPQPDLAINVRGIW